MNTGFNCLLLSRIQSIKRELAAGTACSRDCMQLSVAVSGTAQSRTTDLPKGFEGGCFALFAFFSVNAIAWFLGVNFINVDYSCHNIKRVRELAR